MSLLGLSAVFLSACATPGDFCIVATGPKTIHPDTADMLVETDRNVAEWIAVENEYGRRHCGW